MKCCHFLRLPCANFIRNICLDRVSSSMSAWQHVPGVVVPCSVVFARCGAASASPLQSGPVSLPRPIDADITTGYVDTLTRHWGHSFHYGIASHTVLMGDSDWFQGILPNTVITLLSKFVQTAREMNSMEGALLMQQQHTSGIPDGSVSISAGSFDVSGAGTGVPSFDSNVLRLEIRSSDPVEMCHKASGALQCAASQNGKRIAWVRATVADFNGCEISSTVFVPPPIEKMSWETHHYLRQVEDDLLISRNALTMFVWHASSPVISAHLPSSGEIFVTMSKQKERLCAAIPNTPAAKYLLQGVDGKHAASREQGASPSPQRVAPFSEDLQAMEAELASLRAACLQLSGKNQQLERDMGQLKAVAAQQQQMHQALLEGAAAIAQPSGGGRRAAGGVLLPPMGSHRDAKGTNNGQMVPFHGHMGGREDDGSLSRLLHHLHELEELVSTIQTSMLSAQPNDVLKGCLLWRQQEASVLHACLQVLLSVVGSELPPSLSAATAVGHVTVGTSTGSDPLTGLYRQRLQDTERELVRIAEFDVEGLTSKFYTEELRRMEDEAAAWMTKYHASANHQRRQ